MTTCLGVKAQDALHPVITASTPAKAGMSAGRLQRMDAFLDQCINNGWTNGAVALILHDGKIAYYKSMGYNDVENKMPMRKDHIFRIASQTKAITSVAVMMLYEEGKFLLDDPISKYIPEFKNPVVLDKYNAKDTTYTTIPAKREITIRDLLRHTSGITYAQIGDDPFNAIYRKNGIICGLGLSNHLLADDMKKLGKLPLAHQPGEKFTYGMNVDVLGYLVEIISGMSLDKFFHTRIFEPLGMKDTFFYLPPERQDRLANLYLVDSAGTLRKSPGYFDAGGGDTLYDYPRAKGTYYAGGAGLSSTIMDYAVFLQMLLNKGKYNGQRLLARNTVRMMTTNQLGELSEGVNKFGLGFEITTESGSALSPAREGTFGWGGAFSTVYWVDPKEKIVALLYKQLWNDQHEGEMNSKFKALVYQAIND